MYWNIRDNYFCVHTICACIRYSNSRNCPLWIFKQQEVTEVPCCPFRNPNESISATARVLLVPSTLTIWYGCPAGGNLVADASNNTASPLHYSFTWQYSVVEAISCSHGPLNVFTSMSADITVAEFYFSKHPDWKCQIQKVGDKQFTFAVLLLKCYVRVN